MVGDRVHVPCRKDRCRQSIPATRKIRRERSVRSGATGRAASILVVPWPLRPCFPFATYHRFRYCPPVLPYAAPEL